MRRHIASHAAIRGLAASMVIAYHLREGAFHLSPRFEPSRFLDRGYLWVDLFFILSGFIIAYTATPDGRPLSWANVRRFWMSRVTRIFPLHLVSTLLFILLSAAISVLALRHGDPVEPLWTLRGLVGALEEVLLVHAIGLPGVPPLSAVSWSISAEMYAYALFPVMIIVAARRWGLALLALVPLAFYGWLFARGADLHISYGLAIIRCFAAFIIGLAICLHRDRWARLSDSMSTVLQFLGLGGALLLMALPVNDVFVIPLFALLVLASWSDHGLLPALLKARPLQYLGEISYSLYLMHWWGMMALLFVWQRTIAKLGLSFWTEQLLWALAVPPLALILATLTYRYVELPTRTHFKRRREAREAAIA